jgi:hypothetical protein
MGTLHDNKPKPQNKGQFEGPAPIRPMKRPRTKPKRRSRRVGGQTMLVALAWVAVISGATIVAVLA